MSANNTNSRDQKANHPDDPSNPRGNCYKPSLIQKLEARKNLFKENADDFDRGVIAGILESISIIRQESSMEASGFGASPGISGGFSTRKDEKMGASTNSLIEKLREKTFYVDFTGTQHISFIDAISIICQHEGNEKINPEPLAKESVVKGCENMGGPTHRKASDADNHSIANSPTKCSCAIKHDGECQSSKISEDEAVALWEDEFEGIHAISNRDWFRRAYRAIKPYLRTGVPSSIDIANSSDYAIGYAAGFQAATTLNKPRSGKS